MARKGKLVEYDEVDETYDIMREHGMLAGVNDNERYANAFLGEIHKLLESDDNKDVVKGMMLWPQLKTLIIEQVYGGRDPHLVPYRHIRHALENPRTMGFWKRKGEYVRYYAMPDSTVEQRRSIRGSVRAIRIKCVECQGGSAPLIRACAAVNCALWPFRMGNNPFYGRLGAGSGDDDAAIEDQAENDRLQEEFDREEAERMAKIGGGNANS